MKTGLYISGLAHAALILWLLFGSLFLARDNEDLLQVSQVSILSEAEFAALSAPEPVSVAPATSTNAPARPQPPAPEPEPEPEPEPAPTTPEVAPADIDRVAPEAAPEPEPLVEVAPVVRDPVTPDQAGDVTQPETQATAPEAATTEIVTEVTETAELAPATSARPHARPNRTAPTPEPEPDPEPETETAAATDPLADAVATAVAEATEPSPVPSGPPLSQGEMRALQVSVGNCWNVGSLSSEALGTTVVVGVDMTPEGRPEIASIRMVSFSGGSEASARRAYETARRAIIRCGATGYNLPSAKYEQWREIEMTFNPENMRIK